MLTQGSFGKLTMENTLNTEMEFVIREGDNRGPFPVKGLPKGIKN